jgi:hypothetical protein
VPGATPTEPTVTAVCTPLNETAVPAWTANELQLPSDIPVV